MVPKSPNPHSSLGHWRAMCCALFKEIFTYDEVSTKSSRARRRLTRPMQQICSRAPLPNTDQPLVPELGGTWPQPPEVGGCSIGVKGSGGDVTCRTRPLCRRDRLTASEQPLALPPQRLSGPGRGGIPPRSPGGRGGEISVNVDGGGGGRLIRTVQASLVSHSLGYKPGISGM